MTEPGILDGTPGREQLKATLNMPVFSEGFKRNATVAAVNVETGEYTLFTNKNTKWGDDWAMAAIASGSVPGVL